MEQPEESGKWFNALHCKVEETGLIDSYAQVRRVGS